MSGFGCRLVVQISVAVLAEGEAGFRLNRCATAAPTPRPSVLGSGVRASPSPGVEAPAVGAGAGGISAALRLRCGSGVGSGRCAVGRLWGGVFVGGLRARAQRRRFPGCAVTGARPSLPPGPAVGSGRASPGAGWPPRLVPLPVATPRAPGPAAEPRPQGPRAGSDPAAPTWGASSAHGQWPRGPGVLAKEVQAPVSE